MGASSDRRIGLDHDQTLADALFTHPVRLRFDNSNSTGPAHAYADVHATLADDVWTNDDAPVNALDFKTMHILCLMAVTYPASEALADGLTRVMRAAWGDDVAAHINAVFVGDDATWEPALGALLSLLKANAPLYGVTA